MRYITYFILLFLVSLPAANAKELNSEQLVERVKQVNELQNKVLMAGSTKQDIDSLFAQYTDDFTYVHEVYGGTYSRAGLYKNTVRFHGQGDYQYQQPRYQIIQMMTGLNAIAVIRKQFDGEIHLSVFEFDGEKVKRIIEYWR
ncbi:hypothetical protein MHM98_14570 [Psychrobium sp. MM17-31]|uniref:hypothetical protein n=1 Tax=Psychrobium sp. MM17-31 TaxID=2917758 RepID=UPI001EF6A2B6|nr:hypothetical protein [Psychrobium sp. MM17-31]MCG7532560.1 hypothetical protein [Psychrobium sp. MM17-31]